MDTEYERGQIVSITQFNDAPLFQAAVVIAVRTTEVVMLVRNRGAVTYTLRSNGRYYQRGTRTHKRGNDIIGAAVGWMNEDNTKDWAWAVEQAALVAPVRRTA